MAGNIFPIKKSALEQHTKKVNEKLMYVDRGAGIGASLVDLVKDIEGDEIGMAKEVQDTLGVLRKGFCLYYEMYAMLEDRVRKEKIDGDIDDKAKLEFMVSYSMFAATSFIHSKLQPLTKGEDAAEILLKDPFQFTFTKDGNLNYILARFYGIVDAGKRNENIVKAEDLPRFGIDYFRKVRDSAAAKKDSFPKKLIELVENQQFKVGDDEYSLNGFGVSSVEATGKSKKSGIEFVPVEPYQVAGNVLAKKEMLRDMDRLALYDPTIQKNPIMEVGGQSWSILYHGFPGTGKSTLFSMGRTRIDRRCKQINEMLKGKNGAERKWKDVIITPKIKSKMYGETSERIFALEEETRDPTSMNIGIIDDIDLLMEGDRDSSNGGADKDILNALMQILGGIDVTIRARGGTQWWAATNAPTTMDPALLQRFVGRYEVDGPREWYDFADIFMDKLGLWIKRGIVTTPAGKGYTPFEMRKGETGYEQSDETKKLIATISAKYKGGISLRDIGQVCADYRKQNPRFTGRAVDAVAEAVRKRINDYEIPEDWFEKPEVFFLKEYKERAAMLGELCKKIDGGVIIEEAERYFRTEQEYASNKFEEDVKKAVHYAKVQQEVMRRLRAEADGGQEK